MACCRPWFWLLVLLLPAAAVAQQGGPSPPARPDRELLVPPREVGPTGSAGSVVLGQKDYQEMLDLVARLRGQVKPPRPETPSRCRIGGRVGGDLAVLSLEYEFRTHQPRARVELGCLQGFPSKADLDGRPPSLSWGPEGFLVQAEEAGDHKLTLELELPIEIRPAQGGEPGLVLDLPAAPVTVIEDLRFPGTVRKLAARVTLRDGPGWRPETRQDFRTVTAGGDERFPQRLKTPGLGPVERLELTWQGPPASGNAAPVLALTKSHVLVHVSETEVVTRAELSLGVRRGQTDRWDLVVPPNALVVIPPTEDRVAAVEPSDRKGTVRTIRLKQPTADPVAIAVRVRQARSGPLVPVGPFFLKGAVPQQGHILVTAPARVTLHVQAAAEAVHALSPREATEEEKKLYPGSLAYRYGLQAAPAGPVVPPLFLLDISRVQPVVEAKVTHSLTWEFAGAEGPSGWRVHTSVEANVLHTDVDHLQLSFPSGYEFDDQFGLQPSSDWRWPESADPAKRLVAVALTPPRMGQVKLSFKGRVGPIPPGSRLASIPLPRLEGTIDRGGHQVSVALPAGQEIIPAARDTAWESETREAVNRRVWKFDRMPERLTTAWQPYRPDLAVDGKALVRFSGRQATVRQSLWLPDQRPAGEPLRVRIPEGLLGLRVTPPGGKTLSVEGSGGTTYEVPLTVPPDAARPVILEYVVNLPENLGAPFSLPLVAPAQATRGEMRVFLWSPPGTRPEVVGGPWEARLEEVPGADRYPSAVLVAGRPDAPLSLRVPDAAGAPLSLLRVDRALVQATVAESGQQTYRARFLIAQAATAFLEVELPAPLFQAGSPGPHLRYRGKEAAWSPVDEQGKPVAVSRIGRVELPHAPLGHPAVLEVEFAVAAARPGAAGGVRSMLVPPVLRGDPGLVPVRWQVLLPGRWQLLHREGGFGALTRWGWQGWLLAPRPEEDTADLERWFSESNDPGPSSQGALPAAVCWAGAGAPIVLVHAPKQGWLLVCSLVVLALGMVLLLAPLSRPLYRTLIVALVVSLLATGLLWPGLLSALMVGVQPGLWVLVPLVGLQWYLHHRHRRRIVFLPSFRQTPGSTLVRPGPARPMGEASTLDVPPSAPQPSPSQPSPSQPSPSFTAPQGANGVAGDAGAPGSGDGLISGAEGGPPHASEGATG